MFKTAEKTGLNQISLTGLRALVFIGLLIVKPRSLEEIKQALIDFKIIDKTSSDDILRIDLNTIKIMGCEISRPSPKNDFKYVLTKHPFSFKIPEEEINIIKRVYNIVKSKIDLATLLDYDDLFKKIAFYICDEESREAILGISLLRYYDVEMLKTLILDSKYNNIVTLIYDKLGNSFETKKRLVVQKIVYNNEKIYIYGHDLDKKDSIILNLRRVKSILLREVKEKNVSVKQVNIKFIIKNIDDIKLDNNEKIVEETEAGTLIEAYYHNKFLAMQRVLSFGANCTVIEPDEFKNYIIETIKEMRNTYEC